MIIMMKLSRNIRTCASNKKTVKARHGHARNLLAQNNRPGIVLVQSHPQVTPAPWRWRIGLPPLQRELVPV